MEWSDPLKSSCNLSNVLNQLNFKRPLIMSLSMACLLPFVASCSAGGTSIKEAPENLVPIVEAVTGSTYASWESASSVFSSASNGDKKWSALKAQQKSLFENGDNEPLFYWTSDEKDGWEILRFCSESIVENECSEYDKTTEIHLRTANQKVTDLKWIEDAQDPQSEILIYQITSANPGFGAADFSIEEAITKRNQSGKEVTCYYGKIVLDSDIASVTEEMYLAVRLYVEAETSDGVTLEATSGTSGIIDTRQINKPTPFVVCYEYPAPQIDRLTIGAGEFKLEVFGSRRGNTADISISLEANQL